MRLALFCLMLSAAAAAWAGKAPASAVKLVRQFLQTPTSDLPVEKIDEFLALDSLSLPPELRRGFQAKRLELLTLKHMSDSQRDAGPLRSPSTDCAPPPGSKEADLRVLRFGGFWEEITEPEVDYLLKKTNCTEQELMCEFSLQIAVAKPKKKGAKGDKLKRHFFLHPKDPLMAYLGEFRAGASAGQTRFFGAGGAITCRR